MPPRFPAPFRLLVRPSISIPVRRRPPARYESTFAYVRRNMRANPYLVSISMVMTLAGMVIAGKVLIDQAATVAKIDQRFPEPVAKELRKAIYYTNYRHRPADALRHYRRALAVADEVGMDPMSEEVMGIMIQISYLFEKIDSCQQAIDILETVRRDCGTYLEVNRHKEGIERERTLVLNKAVQISVKLGQLYADKRVNKPEVAEERLVWAVETSLKETARRTADAKKVHPDTWMSNDEIGATAEALADHYMQTEQYWLATPLLLHALSLISPDNCHRIVLMNNLSVSLAQQSPKQSSDLLDPTTTRQSLIQNARQWSMKALEIVGGMDKNIWNEECAEGCATASYNLAEFEEMLGGPHVKKYYQEAKRISKTHGYQPGVEKSEEALKRLDVKTGA